MSAVLARAIRWSVLAVFFVFLIGFPTLRTVAKFNSRKGH